MKAITFNTLGSPSDVLVVSNIEQPSPGNGEVLVRVYSSAVNPSDVKKRAGPSPGLLDDGFIVPHSDGAGVIEAVGFGVSVSRVGERVWLYQCQYGRRFGTAAEYISIPSNRAVTLPAAASFDEGACMGIPAMTAHRCVFFRWTCNRKDSTCDGWSWKGWQLCHSVGQASRRPGDRYSWKFESSRGLLGSRR